MRRRDLVQGAAAAMAALPLTRMAGWAAEEVAAPQRADPWRGFKVGVASYTLRKLPLEGAIKVIRRVGLSYVSIKDAHLPMASSAEERRGVAQRFKEAGITPLSCGNVTMENDAANIRRAFEYARDTGLPTIVCSPHPDSFALLDAAVKEFDIRLAIHNHGPEDKRFPSPYDVWKAVSGHDKRIGLCLDVGHTARAKVDPAEAVRRCHERIYDVHFKDIDSTAPDGKTIEGGRGVLDLASVLKALRDVRYAHLLSFEYEKDEDDPLPGLAETVGYTKGLLSRLA
jgi:sugar phosphate isomerase/epimerase